MRRGWQPIETAPRDGTPVLVTNWPTFKDDPEGFNQPHPVVARFVGEEWHAFEVVSDGKRARYYIKEPHSWCAFKMPPERS